MDIYAPLIPGKQAAGIDIGASMQEIMKKEKDTQFQVMKFKDPSAIRFCSAMVDLWVNDGIVNQIMVHDGYQGLLLDKIGLGSTMQMVEERLGKITLDDEDNRGVLTIPGFCFEVDQHDWPSKYGSIMASPITEIYIYKIPDYNIYAEFDYRNSYQR